MFLSLFLFPDDTLKISMQVQERSSDRQVFLKHASSDLTPISII